MLTKEAAPRNGHDSETSYLAELGKGILLANAKIKLLDDQLVNQSQALHQLISDRLETLNRGSEANLAELRSSVDREARGLRKYLEEMRQAHTALVMETNQQVANCATQAATQVSARLDSNRQTLGAQITKIGETVLAQQQETCMAVMKACSSLAAKVDKTSEQVSYTARDLAGAIDTTTRQLKSWLLGLTVVTVALTSLLMYLLAQVLPKAGR
jgi:hypothetical protein